MIAPAFWRKDYRLQFPCLAGLTVLYQVALPLASLCTQPDEVSSSSLTRFSVMAILCLGAAWAGYEWWQGARQSSVMQLDPKRLVISAVILALFGGFFSLKASTITPDLDPETGQWTGIITIYSTLALVARYGFMLAAILFMQRKDWTLLLLMLPQLWSYYQSFMIGRRSPTGEIIVVICMLLWFYRKRAVPMWLMLLGVTGMAIFCFNVGTIRATVDQPLTERIEAIEEADPLHALTVQGFSESKNYVEIFNASKFMEAKAAGGHYTFGLHFWNKLVFGYVPAQIVGRDVKDRLMIPLVDDTLLTGFEKSNGTCESGIAEAFMAFGYFGCVLFFAIGALMRWLWEGASRGSMVHLFLLMLCTLGTIMSFSAQLWTFLNMLVNVAIFAGPLLWWSRVHTNQQLPVNEPAISTKRGRKQRRVRSLAELAPHAVGLPGPDPRRAEEPSSEASGQTTDLRPPTSDL